MTNRKIIFEILNMVEQNHLNLYHDISKEEVLNHINSVENINQLNKFEFDRVCLKLFALFKDAHTSFYISREFFDKQLVFIENQLYIKQDNNFSKVLEIGDMPVNDFLLELETLINYETNAWLQHEINVLANNYYIYEMLSLTKNKTISFLIEDENQTKIIEAHKIKSDNYFALYPKSNKYYEYKILDNGTLYIKYRVCQNQENYPFEEFVNDIRCDLENKSCSNFILDLRGNTGGNSGIINPLKQLLHEKNLKGPVLIDNGVFSSGRFAVSHFKEEFGSVLIGEETGGAAKSYGYNKNLQFENFRFSASLRLWDFSDIYNGDEGSIKPDIYVPETIENLKNNTDATLLAAIDYLTKQKDTEYEKQ